MERSTVRKPIFRHGQDKTKAWTQNQTRNIKEHCKIGFEMSVVETQSRASSDIYLNTCPLNNFFSVPPPYFYSLLLVYNSTFSSIRKNPKLFSDKQHLKPRLWNRTGVEWLFSATLNINIFNQSSFTRTS